MRSLYRRKIYRITGFLALVALILYFPQTSFAQDPILSAVEVTALNYDEGQIPAPITNTIIVSDADSPLLTNATIKIASNFSNTEDYSNSLTIFPLPVHMTRRLERLL